MTLKLGLSATVSEKVTPEMTASAVGSGLVPVFSTPELARLIEQAAVAALDGALDDGQTTVGTNLNFDHLAATPVGMTVSATATLQAIDGRKLVFEIAAQDDIEPVAKGTHTRFMVNSAKFVAKAEKKAALVKK